MPGTSGPKNARCPTFDWFSEMAPYVRPWNAPLNAMTYCRLVCARTSLSAPSTASVPEFERNTLHLPMPGTDLARRSAMAAKPSK